MSRETDTIIEFARAFDPSVIVTATTGGQHVADSFHYREGTPSPTGTEGLAVDFDFVGIGRASKRFALAKHFMTVAPKLAELFYTPLGRSVKYGNVQNFTVAGHNDHVHVAVLKGVFLTAAEPVPQEDDMPTPHSCIAPSGRGWWQLNPDGSVEARTFAPGGSIAFHGSMYDYPQERTKINPKTGKPRIWTTIQAVGARDEDGYFVFADDGFCGKLVKK
jgi:hypothetical protein